MVSHVKLMTLGQTIVSMLRLDGIFMSSTENKVVLTPHKSHCYRVTLMSIDKEIFFINITSQNK